MSKIVSKRGRWRLAGAVAAVAVGLAGAFPASSPVGATDAYLESSTPVARTDLFAGAGGPGAGGSSKFSPRVDLLAAAGRSGRAPSEQSAAMGLPVSGPGSPSRDGRARPLLYVRVANTSGTTVDALREKGATIVHVSGRYRVVTIALEARLIGSLAEVPPVSFVSEVLTPATRGAVPGTGGAHRPYPAPPSCAPIVSQGDVQLRAALARSAAGVSGSGVTVGVLSDSYDVSTFAATRAANDIASGDLPGPGNPCGRSTPVVVLHEGQTGDTDEGRAMLQIVHDLAPDATLKFATGFGGLFQMADHIGELVAAGADVIVDDITYFAEPFFQDGPISVAVSEARASGVTYVSSAGNSNGFDAGVEFNGYESPAYRPTTCPRSFSGITSCHSFRSSGAGDSTYRFVLDPGASAWIDLQWAEPWYGVETDFDAFLLEGTTVRASSADDNPAGGVPFEFISYRNAGSSAKTLSLVVGRYAGAGTPRLKLIFVGTSGVRQVEHAIPDAPNAITGTIFGHNGSRDAISVAAVPYFDDTTPESYSSRGPVTHYFGPAVGTSPAPPLPVGQVFAKPDVTATDGARNTFFGNPSGGSFLFFGTSASAPHVAAIAALMKSSQPAIEPDTLAGVLSSTSRPMSGGTPRSVGGGMVDALAAASAVSAGSPRISIGDASVTEGDSGTVEGIFTVGLWPALVDGSATVDFTTADGTAKSPEDFTATSGSLSFGPGETSRTILIPVKGDTLPEGSETFGVNLGNAVGATVSDASAIGTILDTDEAVETESLLFSLENGATLPGGFAVQNEDVVRFDPSGGYSMVFDGSDVGLGSAAIDGLARVDDDELLLSFTGSVTIPGAGSVRGEDLVRFTGTFGSDTRGVLSLAFDGSDIGLNPSGDENIDAIELEGGVLYLSTKGSFSVKSAASSVAGKDEDVFACRLPVFGSTSSCGALELVFGGGRAGLAASDEDVDAFAFHAGGSFFSTTGNFSVTGASGADEDALRCAGAPHTCDDPGSTFSTYFDGSARGVSGDLAAIEFGP